MVVLPDLLSPISGGHQREVVRDEQDGHARTLNLHPNAVGYRLRQITSALGHDLSDADVRLVLHLACRSRLLDQSSGSL